MVESELTAVQKLTEYEVDKHVKTFPEGESVVSMCVWRDSVYVATNCNLYVYFDGELHLIAISKGEWFGGNNGGK